jgi:hypothetical protein
MKDKFEFLNPYMKGGSISKSFNSSPKKAGKIAYNLISKNYNFKQTPIFNFTLKSSDGFYYDYKATEKMNKKGEIKVSVKTIGKSNDDNKLIKSLQDRLQIFTKSYETQYGGKYQVNYSDSSSDTNSDSDVSSLSNSSSSSSNKKYKKTYFEPKNIYWYNPAYYTNAYNLEYYYVPVISVYDLVYVIYDPII